MGYEVYITRAADHREGPQLPIPQRDWRALIATDPELTAPDDAAPDFARWSGRTSVRKPWIDWSEGNLFTVDPDYSVLRKLVELAGLLGGHVEGRDGERYSVERSIVVREDPREEPASRPAPGSDAGVPNGDGPPPGIETGLTRAELDAELDDLFAELAPSGEALGTLTAAGTNRGDPNTGFARGPDERLQADARPAAGADVPFVEGQRVRTPWGRPATIVRIDRMADGGLGEIELRYDDGRTATTNCVSHGLEPE
jgi:hypothetical protein